MSAPDAVARSLELISRAERHGASLRMVGGVAIAYLCGSESRAADLDFVAGHKDRSAVESAMTEAGFASDREFNHLYGHKRLYFEAPDGVPVDVFMGRMEMCHMLDLRSRLQLFSPTVPPADLALSKLQIVQFTEKDHRDTQALLEHVEITERHDAIDPRRIGEVTSEDWGWFQTVSQNLERFTASGGVAGAHANALRELAEDAPLDHAGSRGHPKEVVSTPRGGRSRQPGGGWIDMATVGVLSFSDGREFAHEIVRPEIQATERALRKLLEAGGHEVVAADEPVWSNHDAVREGRRLRAVNPDCVVFNFSAWAFPHFAMLAASEITSPLILMSNLDPARPGLVAMLAAAGGLDQVGRRYARVWGDVGDGEVRDRLEVQIAAAGAVSRLRGMTFGRIGGRPMGMYTATAGTDVWLARFGIDVEEVDQFELVRRAEEADAAEARQGRAWLEQNCRAVHYDGRLLTPELLERQLRMYLAMRALIDELRFDFTGIKGQPELTTHFATADVAEALLNDPYDWNGPKAPHVCATEADMDGALTMKLLQLLSGTPVLFADVRHYHRDRDVWDLCNSGQHATWLAGRSADPEENLRQVELFPAQFYFPAGGASVYHVAAPGEFTFARLTRGDGRYRMHLLHGSAERFDEAENKALAEQSTETWPHMFARLDATPEAFLGSYASNHIHAVPDDRRAELRSVCELLDVDCIEL